MGFALDAFFNAQSTIRKNDAAFAGGEINDARLGLTNGAGSSDGVTGPSIFLAKSDARLEGENAQNGFEYQALDAMEESSKKRRDENIRDSFSTFA